jgi:putative addiction module killer protein
VAAAQVRLSQGNTSSVKWFSGLGEYVIDWGPGYRVYLARDGEELIVLFGGGTKRSATSRGPRNCSPNTRPARPR